MLTYHDDPIIKAKYVERFAAHRAADEVIQGHGFDNGRGCFVGCTLDAYSHSRFPIELGWPEWLAHLADAVFEGLSESEAPQFGTDLLAAVPVGVDLEPVRARFLLTVQRRNLARLEGNREEYAVICRAAIQGVVDCLNSNDAAVAAAAESAARLAARSAAGSAAAAAAAAAVATMAEAAAREVAAAAVAMSAWFAARSAARSATAAAKSAAAREAAAAAAAAVAMSAWFAARSAARSVAISAISAESAAARSAESAAESAAMSSVSSVSAESLVLAEFQLQRDDLLSLVRACEVQP